MTEIDAPTRDESQVSGDEELSPTATQLLQLMWKPERFSASNRELAKLLGVSGRRVQQIKSSPAFRRAFLALTRRRLLSHLPVVFEAMAKSAATPGRDGAQDRRMYLQLVGLLPMPGAGPAKSARSGDGDAAGRLIAALNRVEKLGPAAPGVIEHEDAEDADFREPSGGDEPSSG